jgi:hypothetical protein
VRAARFRPAQGGAARWCGLRRCACALDAGDRPAGAARDGFDATLFDDAELAWLSGAPGAERRGHAAWRARARDGAARRHRDRRAARAAAAALRIPGRRPRSRRRSRRCTHEQAAFRFPVLWSRRSQPAITPAATSNPTQGRHP